MWLINEENKKQLRKDMKRALSLDTKDAGYNLTLGFDERFTRKLPPLFKTTNNKFEAQLNYSNALDCNTRQQLLEFTDFDCSKNVGKNMTIHFS